ncbi:MAG: FGGY-family carbohydrate kinase [Sulfitobacter sp.]
MTGHIAIIDIGKTNAKLVLVEKETLTEVQVITRPNTVLPGPPWPHFDVEGHWEFLLNGLRDFHASHAIDAISVTTHGACVALLDKAGNLAAPILDYEHAGPDELATEYDAIRPAFAETGSPRLTGGLNIGAQLFWQFHIDPDLKMRTHRIVTYPQYWSARLSGVAATDITSMGAHTDLWNPHEGRFSSLVTTLEISEILAPVHKPSDVLGPILPQIAQQTGLSPDTPIYCGIHDSNASLLPYILESAGPYSVVSTGTWVIAMAIGGKSVPFDPTLDTLINVTALGQLAPSGRFMGGREHDVATGGPYPVPTPVELSQILTKGTMLLPAVVPNTGPFQGRRATWLIDEPAVGTGERGAAVALYLALVTAQCLENIGHVGEVVVEGPFANNLLYLQMLSVAVASDVYPATGTTGTSTGAALLVTGQSSSPLKSDKPIAVDPNLANALAGYASCWRQKVATPQE